MTGKKILLVDFDVNSLKSLTEILESHEINVVTATDGASAYEKFKQEMPDMVILEAMLPKLHGFDLTLKIFQETKGQVPVIIITGVYKGPQYKSEALRSFGASDYYEKPIDEKALMDSVMNLLSEEEDIQEELPDPEAVIKNIEEMAKNSPRPSKNKKPSPNKG
jgi:DNA-binding response OmpR family regulator